MFTLTLEIITDNSAFEDDYATVEINRIINKYITDQVSSPDNIIMDRTIRDINGNNVGLLTIHDYPNQ